MERVRAPTESWVSNGGKLTTWARFTTRRTLARVKLPFDQRPAYTRLLQRVTVTRLRLRSAMRRAEALLSCSGAGGSGAGGSGAGGGGPSESACEDEVSNAVSPQRTTSGATRGSAAEEEEDDDEFEDAADLKAGYELNWVDPEAGWESPPTEAMLPQIAAPNSSVSSAAVSSAASGEDGESKAVAATAPAAGAADARLYSATSGIAHGRCGAPRRNGSRCSQFVGGGAPCAFHGRCVARDPLAGRPVLPRASSIWEQIERIERHAEGHEERAQHHREAGGRGGSCS